MPDPFDSPAVAAPVLWWLRLEGLCVAALSAILYARTGSSWWLFAALWLAPDLSFFGYLAGPRLGSHCYNAVHSYLLPATFAAVAIVFHQKACLPCVLIWCNHIGVDRLVGYGLKYPSGFGFTHLRHARKS
jgi:hypothetical protein